MGLPQILKYVGHLFRPIHNTDWQAHETPDGPVMRRRMNGEYQTRPMTDDEMKNYLTRRRSPVSRKRP
jgi:hypothetical protein